MTIVFQRAMRVNLTLEGTGGWDPAFLSGGRVG